jgi:oligopeptidase B
VYRTRSLKYLVLGMGSLTTSEARVLPADQPAAEWKVVAPRVHDQEYDLDHHGDWFYIRVNDTGRNFRLVKAPVEAPAASTGRRSCPTGRT